MTYAGDLIRVHVKREGNASIDTLAPTALKGASCPSMPCPEKSGKVPLQKINSYNNHFIG